MLLGKVGDERNDSRYVFKLQVASSLTPSTRFPFPQGNAILLIVS